MVKILRFNNPKRPSKILALSFWWNRIIHTWDVGFLNNKATELHGLRWVSMFDVCVASARRFAYKEEIGKKILLSPKEELEYEKNCYQVKKRCRGGYLRGETTIAKKEIGLICWKRTRRS
jgi:hypothetical protein